MPKPKRGETGSLSKSECQKLQRLCTKGAAVRSSSKASNLSVSMVRQFLQSKVSYTKFTLVTRKFKRLKASNMFRKKTWCMDLAFVD